VIIILWGKILLTPAASFDAWYTFILLYFLQRYYYFFKFKISEVFFLTSLHKSSLSFKDCP
jgi:hypothetical protein